MVVVVVNVRSGILDKILDKMVIYIYIYIYIYMLLSGKWYRSVLSKLEEHYYDTICLCTVADGRIQYTAP